MNSGRLYTQIMNVLFGNYGNHTIATIQWLYEQKLTDVYVISIDTGWAADTWLTRVNIAEAFVKKCNFNVVRLSSNPNFETLIKDRQEFPSTKFQWCAGFLKGLTLLNWLDQHDPLCQATIVFGKRRADSRANFDLPEIIPESEHYGERKVWYPLYNCDNLEFTRLIKASTIELLAHRSLECEPCVNNAGADFVRISDNDCSKTQALEQAISNTMFELPIASRVKQARARTAANNHIEPTLEMFSMGCGSPFGCGE